MLLHHHWLAAVLVDSKHPSLAAVDKALTAGEDLPCGLAYRVVLQLVLLVWWKLGERGSPH